MACFALIRACFVFSLNEENRNLEQTLLLTLGSLNGRKREHIYEDLSSSASTKDLRITKSDLYLPSQRGVVKTIS